MGLQECLQLTNHMLGNRSSENSYLTRQWHYWHTLEQESLGIDESETASASDDDDDWHNKTVMIVDNENFIIVRHVTLIVG